MDEGTDTPTTPRRRFKLRSLRENAKLLDHKSARAFIYYLLHEDHRHSTKDHFAAARLVRFSLEILIVANVIVVILETVHSLHVRFATAFFVIDVISVAVFATEYVLRLWSIPESPNPKYAGRGIMGRLRWMVSVGAIIDLIAIIPFLIHVLPVDDLRVLRALRLLRLERLLMLGRYSRSLGTVVHAIRVVRHELYASMLVIALVLLVSSALMFYVEHEAQPLAFPNIPAAMWWGVTTLTSVGYGDVVPITPLGKVFGGIIALLGILVVAIPAGLIVTGFIDITRTGKLCPHCGGSLDDTHFHKE